MSSRAGRQGCRSADPGRYYDKCVSAPVRIKGRNVSFATPDDHVDAMLSEPAFKTWVESRYPHARFYTGMGGPVKNKPFFDRWDELGYNGGPAPMDTRKAYAMGGGPNDDWVKDLLIDVWTAEVFEMSIVSGTFDPPVGEYPSPVPSAGHTSRPTHQDGGCTRCRPRPAHPELGHAATASPRTGLTGGECRTRRDTSARPRVL